MLCTQNIRLVEKPRSLKEYGSKFRINPEKFKEKLILICSRTRLYSNIFIIKITSSVLQFKLDHLFTT